MTKTEIQHVVRRHRRAAYLGGGVGLLAVAALAGWWVNEIVQTPPQLDVGVAAASEIVAYMTDPRGFQKLTDVEQERFWSRWRERLADPQRVQELARHVGSMPEGAERKAFVEVATNQFKRRYLDDARQFARLAAADDKHRFVRDRILEYRDEALLMKDVGAALQSEFDGRQETIQKWIMEHTTPEERSIGEAYYNALARVREQIKKQERAATDSGAPAATPPSDAQPGEPPQDPTDGLGS